MQNSSLNIISMLASAFLLIIATFNIANSAPSPDAGSFLANANASCDACVEEFKQIDAYATKFSTKFIVWFVGEICPQIIGYEQECVIIVENYLKNAIKTLHDDLARDPKWYCWQLGFCRGRNDVAAKLFKMFDQQYQKNMLKKFGNLYFGKLNRLDEKPICQQCIDYCKQMDEYVTKFGPILIEYIGTKICPQMLAYEASCKLWSKKYLEMGIQRAHHFFGDPLMLCKSMGLC